MDPALLGAFRTGNHGALEEIYRAHVGRVEGFIRRELFRVKRFSAANLADVVQDVFLRAFSDSARASYDGKRDYGPFVLAIAHNVLIDWLRRSTREVVEACLLEPEVEAGVEPTEEDLFDPELVLATARYVEGLSPELRSIHERRFVQAEPQRSAAETLGISRQSLRTLEKKLVDGLRRELSWTRFSGRKPTLQPKPARLRTSDRG